MNWDEMYATVYGVKLVTFADIGLPKREKKAGKRKCFCCGKWRSVDSPWYGSHNHICQKCIEHTPR